MAAPRHDLRYFRTGRRGITKTEAALTLAVIVGLGFVSFRVMNMGGAVPVPPPSAALAAADSAPTASIEAGPATGQR